MFFERINQFFDNAVTLNVLCQFMFKNYDTEDIRC